ncbi:MAG: hypothetical protein IH987_02805 [Planctomycetes bacterium]|nr:hypothetical protein [Planctomycetota bacterium]
MSLTHPPTFCFSELKAPRDHGDVLVAPDPSGWIPAARANHKALNDSETPLLQSTLGEWRRRTREAITGNAEQMIVVTGHQPAFIHPGVWAKHIAAARFAEATSGSAVNLVVDSDVPKRTSLAIAMEEGGQILLRGVPYAELQVGHSYEQIARQDAKRMTQFEASMRHAMGPRFDRSQVPLFLGGMRSVPNARDWVDQAVAGRRAVEAKFGVTLDDRRISQCCPGPLLADMLLNAPRYVASYNAALAAYRTTHGIRGVRRPIPDLHLAGDRLELPVWAWRPNDHRHRLFVSRNDENVRLFAEEVFIGDLPVRSLDSMESLAPYLGDWRLRPRALTLTIWARLLLADLFVHGIGGAKYDRISDRIMADYYGVVPPYMACVSATLRLDLPDRGITPKDLALLRRGLRDFQFNPQRYVAGRTELGDLIERRAAAVELAAKLRRQEPRNRAARRRAFQEIRHATAAVVDGARDGLEAKRSELDFATTKLEQASIARGREYFFGLFREESLHELMDALPSAGEFRV